MTRRSLLPLLLAPLLLIGAESNRPLDSGADPTVTSLPADEAHSAYREGSGFINAFADPAYYTDVRRLGHIMCERPVVVWGRTMGPRYPRDSFIDWTGLSNPSHTCALYAQVPDASLFTVSEAVTFKDPSGTTLGTGTVYSRNTTTNRLVLDLSTPPIPLTIGDKVVRDADASQHEVLALQQNDLMAIGCASHWQEAVAERYCGTPKGVILLGGQKPWDFIPYDPAKRAGAGYDATIWEDLDFDGVHDAGEDVALDPSWLLSITGTEYNENLAHWSSGVVNNDPSGNQIDWSWISGAGGFASCCYNGTTTCSAGDSCPIGVVTASGAQATVESLAMDLCNADARRFAAWHILRNLEAMDVDGPGMGQKPGWLRPVFGATAKAASCNVTGSRAYWGPARPAGDSQGTCLAGLFADTPYGQSGQDDYTPCLQAFNDELLTLLHVDYASGDHGFGGAGRPWYVGTNNRVSWGDLRGAWWTLLMRRDPLFLGEITTFGRYWLTAYQPSAGPPPANQAPIADAGADQSLGDPDASGDASASVDGSSSTDDVGIATWTWERVDPGTGDVVETYALATSTGSVVVPVGTWTVRLTVCDGDATPLCDSDTLTVVVAANQPPVATDSPDVTVTDTDGNGSEAGTIGCTGTDPDGSYDHGELFEGATSLGVVTPPATSKVVTEAVGAHDLTCVPYDNAGQAGTPDHVLFTVDPQTPPPNVAPTAVLEIDGTQAALHQATDSDGDGFAAFSYDARSSTDPEDGAPVGYAFKCPPSTGAAINEVLDHATVNAPVGDTDCELVVTDSGSLTGSATTTLRVIGAAPVVTGVFVTPNTVTTGGGVTLDVTFTGSTNGLGFSWNDDVTGAQLYSPSANVQSPSVSGFSTPETGKQFCVVVSNAYGSAPSACVPIQVVAAGANFQIVLSASRRTGPAPLGVQLSAIGTRYLPYETGSCTDSAESANCGPGDIGGGHVLAWGGTVHDVDYWFDAGKASTSPPSWGAYVGKTGKGWDRSTNLSGPLPVMAVVYDQPGTYTPSVQATEQFSHDTQVQSGLTEGGGSTIIVADPDGYFGSIDCIAPSGGSGGMGRCDNTYTSICGHTTIGNGKWVKIKQGASLDLDACGTGVDLSGDSRISVWPMPTPGNIETMSSSSLAVLTGTSQSFALIDVEDGATPGILGIETRIKSSTTFNNCSTTGGKYNCTWIKVKKDSRNALIYLWRGRGPGTIGMGTNVADATNPTFYSHDGGMIYAFSSVNGTTGNMEAMHGYNGMNLGGYLFSIAAGFFGRGGEHNIRLFGGGSRTAGSKPSAGHLDQNARGGLLMSHVILAETPTEESASGGKGNIGIKGNAGFSNGPPYKSFPMRGFFVDWAFSAVPPSPQGKAGIANFGSAKNDNSFPRVEDVRIANLFVKPLWRPAGYVGAQGEWVSISDSLLNGDAKSMLNDYANGLVGGSGSCLEPGDSSASSTCNYIRRYYREYRNTLVHDQVGGGSQQVQPCNSQCVGWDNLVVERGSVRGSAGFSGANWGGNIQLPSGQNPFAVSIPGTDLDDYCVTSTAANNGGATFGWGDANGIETLPATRDSGFRQCAGTPIP
jgi:hypothetical protein